jgi:cell division protein YceG involved in septum cleavage
MPASISLSGTLLAGSYKLKPSMSLPEIAAKIAGGDADPETYWFTIPEGYTIEQIAGSPCRSFGLVDREAFLKEAAATFATNFRAVSLLTGICGKFPGEICS